MKKSCLTLLLCALGISTAQAQSGWQDNWLLGVSGGYAGAKGPFVLTINDIPGQNVFQRTYEDQGFLAGVLAGYQARCQRWVMGLEINADWRDLDKTHGIAGTLVPPSVGAPFVGSVEYEREWAVALTGRVGYAVSSYLMPYLRVGVEGSDDSLTVNLSQSNGTPVSLDNSEWTYRLVAGIGAEIPLAILLDGLTARAEYMYHHRGQGVNGTLISSSLFYADEMKQRNQTGRLSLVWNFG